MKENELTYTTIKNVCLFLAGGGVGLLASYVVAKFLMEVNPLDVILILVIFVILLAFFGFDGKRFLDNLYTAWRRSKNDDDFTIGIFAPFHINEMNSSWVNFSLQDLSSFLQKRKQKHSFLLTEKQLNNFSVILNPYGGVYPEENIENFTSLNRIFDYVRGGGIYINISDIPFYYAFDKTLKRRVDTTPLIDSGPSGAERPFYKSAFTSKLQIRVVGLPPGRFKGGIERILELNETTKNIFSESIPFNNSLFSPMIVAPFGKGCFVLSTLSVDKNKLETIVADLIEKGFALADIVSERGEYVR